MTKLAICVGDGGAFNFFFANGDDSVYTRLENVGYEIDIYAATKGVARDKLEAAQIAATPSDGTDIVFSVYDAALFGTIGKPQSFELFLNGSRAAQAAGVPVVWCGDYFGSGCETIARNIRPNALYAPDDLTGRTFLDQRASYKESNVVVTGSPVFDPIPNFNYPKSRKEGREKLGLGFGDEVVLHFADGLDQNDFEPYEVIGPWLRRNQVKFGVYFHPNDVKNYAAKVGTIKGRLHADLGDRLIPDDVLGRLKGLERGAAADFVTTGFSTAAVEACLTGAPTAFIMLEKGQELWSKTKNLKKPFFPVLEDQQGSYAPAIGIFERNMNGLDIAIERDKGQIDRFLEAERFQKLCDGRAAERVVAEIVKRFPV
ncbi:MAG: hypothetical protein KBD50_03485 [Candidatus Pacebacteria bacterium]|nr:hypothetical protein [Candidatus Paceibacterota bacterium]